MIIQLIVCLIAGLIYLYYQKPGNQASRSSLKPRNRFINIMTVVMILQSGLRNVAVGPDTYAYFKKFEGIVRYSWGDIANAFYSTYIAGVGKDPGYLVFMKLSSILIDNYQVFLFLIAIIFFLALRSMMRRFCLTVFDVLVAVLVYQALFYGFFSITGIRQTLAVALLFFSIRFVQDRQFFPFLLICLVALTLHKSSVIFLPFYFVARIKKPKVLLLCVLASLPVMFYGLRPFALYLTSFEFTESYAYYTTAENDTSCAVMFMVFMLGMALLMLYVKPGPKGYSTTSLICLNAISTGLFFMPLTWIDQSLMRVVMYFSVFSIFILGGLVRNLCERLRINQQLMAIAVFMLFSAVIVKRSYDYAFFWEQMSLPENYIFKPTDGKI